MSENNSTDAHILAVCSSPETGTRKKKIACGVLVENYGLENDAHASSKTHRQISLLAIESIEKMRVMGLAVNEGDFAENITTAGINLLTVPVGSQIELGDDAVIEITQHGKKCHSKCEIFKQAGTCIMPKEGIFAKVIKGGSIKAGDTLKVNDMEK